MVHHRCLQPAEADVVALVQHRPREGDGLRVALAGLAVDGRPARVTEAEEAGHLVERLAGCIVDGAADEPVLAVVAHLDDHRVPARHQQHHQRELQRRVFEERRVEVRLVMVHADERHVPRQRQRLGRRHTHQQRPDQPRAHGARHGVDAPLVDSCLDDGAGDDGVQHVEVGATGDLGHHPAVLGVQVDLGAHHARHHIGAAHHQRCGGLVAAGLDAEDERVGTGHDGTAAHRTASGHSSASRSRYGGSAMSWHHITMASSVFS